MCISLGEWLELSDFSSPLTDIRGHKEELLSCAHPFYIIDLGKLSTIYPCQEWQELKKISAFDKECLDVIEACNPKCALIS